MTWVWIVLGIALFGLLSAIAWGVWLFHKAADLWSEVKALGKRGDEINELLAQLDLDQLSAAPQHTE